MKRSRRVRNFAQRTRDSERRIIPRLYSDCDTCNVTVILYWCACTWHFAIYLSFHMSLKDEMRLSSYTCFLFANVWDPVSASENIRDIAPLGGEPSRVMCHFRANKRYVKYFDIFNFDLLKVLHIFFSLTCECYILENEQHYMQFNKLECNLICQMKYYYLLSIMCVIAYF